MVLSVGSVFAVTGSWELLEKRGSEVKSVTAEAVVSGDGDYVYWRLAESDKLELILNLPAKEGSMVLMKNYGCKFGVNGGFYGKDDRPIGLVISDGNEINPVVKSGLFNGFVWVDKSGKFDVGRMQPSVYESQSAIQTGPILIENGKAMALNIKNDKPARRMAAVKLADGTGLFMAIYDWKSRLDGPKLADLPDKLLEIAGIEGLTIKTAVNLDGGAASAFHSPEVSISEWSAVGTWWCVK